MDQINYGYYFSPVDLQIQCNLSQNWATSSVEAGMLILKLIWNDLGFEIAKTYMKENNKILRKKAGFSKMLQWRKDSLSKCR